MSDKSVEKKQKAEIEKQKAKNYGRTLGLLTGLSLLAVGVGYFGNIVGLWAGFTLFFPGWWSLFILIPCLAGVIESGLASPYTAGLAFGTLMLLMNMGLVESVWKLALPVAFAYGGLSLIFRNKPFSFRRIYDTDSGKAYMIPIFRSFIIKKSIKIEEGFGGAEVTAWFSPVVIDLTKAKVGDEVIMYVKAIFAPVTIIIDPNINLRAIKIAGSGKLDIQAINYSDILNMSTLHVNATCRFNNVCVKN